MTQYTPVLLSGENPSPVSHPPHLNGDVWRSALIPFCAFKTDLNMSQNSLGISRNHLTIPGITFPLYSSFLEGQLCYKLALNETSVQGIKMNWSCFWITTKIGPYKDLQQRIRLASLQEIRSILTQLLKVSTVCMQKSKLTPCHPLSVLAEEFTRCRLLRELLPLDERHCDVEL